jgi:hypothetical protein
MNLGETRINERINKIKIVYIGSFFCFIPLFVPSIGKYIGNFFLLFRDYYSCLIFFLVPSTGNQRKGSV